MKPGQSSLDSITMQETFGCAVENRFFQLQDDDCDPLDLLYQAAVAVGQRKKKEDSTAKKLGNQKGNKKESQKDRKISAISSAEESGQKRAPKPTLQKVIPNEFHSAEVTDRAERRIALEFRPNFVERPMEYSLDNFEKEKQVRNWVANQRGGFRGRARGGFPRNMENGNQRGRREFERHSGSDRARVRAEDKRGGSGPRNWGSIKDVMSEEEPVPVENVENPEPFEAPEGEQEYKISEESIEDYLEEMSLDEWKSMMDQSRPKTEFNLRKPESSMPSKAVLIHKSKFAKASLAN
ncbi:intracellular hyaluronan-binding protein 4 isoform 1-T2 [Mantella aurantiaca]